MTIKHIRKNISAENITTLFDIQIERDSSDNLTGIILTRKNFYNDNTAKNVPDSQENLLDYFYTKDEINERIKIHMDFFDGIDDLPEEGQENYIYLIPFEGEGDEEEDMEGVFKEYIWSEANHEYEKVGSTDLRPILDRFNNLATVATSGSYSDLIDEPTKVGEFENDVGYLTTHQDISGKANIADLATVATSGEYEDLENKPDLATVATSGDYNDLENKPINVSEFENDAEYLTTHQDISGKANIADLATVATTGSYNDLEDTPTNISTFDNDAGYLTEDDINGQINSGNLARVATTGSYNDLDDKPTDISTFNNDIGYLVEDDISGKADISDIPTIPTNVSEFENDAGYLTEIPKGSFSELRKLINKQFINEPDSEDIIILDKDYKNTGNESAIDIDRNITIIGNGHIIEGDKKNNIFSISSDNITFRLTSLILKNGKNNTSSGGAISSTRTNSPIFINNCTFIKNEAKEHGGAIYSKYSPLTISDCNFYENAASTFNGGAIYCPKTSSISNSYFVNNVARSPGNDIYSTENGLIIYNCHNPSGLYNCVNKELKYEEFEITYDDNEEEETEIITFLVLDNS